MVVASLTPGIVLPLESYAAHGYLTLDATLLVALFLPCAILAFLASLHEARVLWSVRSREEAVVMLGLPAVVFLLAGLAAFGYVSGETTCYHCDSAWFFMLVVPALVLEFAAGIVWLFLTRDALRERPAVASRTG